MTASWPSTSAGTPSPRPLRACALLRAAGFKIVLHWMPNLLGATLESDRADFARLWQPPPGPGPCPDEIKIYPTQLLEGTELYATTGSAANTSPTPPKN